MAKPINTSTTQWIDPEAQYQFDPNSETQLATGNQLLQLIARRALELSPTPFKIAEGYRSPKKQQQAAASGASKVKFSKHNYPSSLAFDITYLDEQGNEVKGSDWKRFKKYMPPVADAFRRAAEEMGVNLRWGGGWENVRGTTENPLKMYEDYVKKKRQLMLKELQNIGVDTSAKTVYQWESFLKNKKKDPKYGKAAEAAPLHDTGHFELYPDDLSTYEWVVG
jgi:peptidoglycan L-alanyl-D-glutamate endopeptidase CwlK